MLLSPNSQLCEEGDTQLSEISPWGTENIFLSEQPAVIRMKYVKYAIQIWMRVLIALFIVYIIRNYRQYEQACSTLMCSTLVKLATRNYRSMAWRILLWGLYICQPILGDVKPRVLRYVSMVELPCLYAFRVEHVYCNSLRLVSKIRYANESPAMSSGSGWKALLHSG